MRCGVTALEEEAQMLDAHALLMLCRGGRADITVNFITWHIHRDTAMMLFPGDIACVSDASPDFDIEMLRFDESMLREASLQLEHTVYDELRRDRCRSDEREVAEIVDKMFCILRVYFRQDDCHCKGQLALYQLKSFFLGFHDYMIRRHEASPADDSSHRASFLFTVFMKQLTRDFKLSRSVAYYAGKLNISPKYLNAIVRKATGQTPKAIIDHYVTMHIKLDLRTTPVSVKQMAWDYHFSDESFFCRHFHRHTGMTPQEYRRKYKT